MAFKTKNPASKRSRTAALVPIERITQSILLLRHRKVMLDSDLATLYSVSTKVLVQAVKRNVERFPEDFMFQLTQEEVEILKSQTVTSRSWGGRRTSPYAFTEQGVAMLSSVLGSARAVKINIAIMRAFVQLRGVLASHADLVAKLDALERKCDAQFHFIFEAIRKAVEPPQQEEPRTKRIGFRSDATPGDGEGWASPRIMMA
jgi:hypothetical protein